MSNIIADLDYIDSVTKDIQLKLVLSIACHVRNHWNDNPTLPDIRGMSVQQLAAIFIPPDAPR